MKEVTIYTTRFCPFCIRAKNLLDDKSVNYTEIKVDNNPGLRKEMMDLSGRNTVPQIWIDKQHIGGCDELYQLQRSQQLDSLLGIA